MKGNGTVFVVFLTVAVCWGGLFHVPIAHSALIDIDNSQGHVVYDTQTKQNWYWAGLREFSYPTSTYSEQIDQIAALNTGGGYYGITTWHMAQLVDMEKLMGYSVVDVGPSFAPSACYQLGSDGSCNWRSNPNDYYRIIWAGRIDSVLPDTGSHAVASMGLIQQGPVGDGLTTFYPFKVGDSGHFEAGNLVTDNTTPLFVGAWVTSAPVPEPSSWLLLTVGLAGLLGWQWKLRGCNLSSHG